MNAGRVRAARKRGKIPKTEWPHIAARYRAGESYASIGRRYGCSPQAIRYIVGRSALRQGPGGTADKEGRAMGIGGEPPGGYADTARFPTSFSGFSETVLRRTTSDIASFLTAFDAVLQDPSLANVERLRQATDDLIHLAARVRVELTT